MHFMTSKDATFSFGMKFKQTANGWSIDVDEFPALDADGTLASLVSTVPTKYQTITYTRSLNDTTATLTPGVWDKIAVTEAVSPADPTTLKISVSDLNDTNVTAYFDPIASGTAITADDDGYVKKESANSYSIVSSDVTAENNTQDNTYYKLKSAYSSYTLE